MSKSNTLLFISNSRMPENSTAYGSNKVVGLVLEIEKGTGEIVNVDSTFITSLAREFVYKLLINQNINDVEYLTRKVQERFLASTRKSLVKAIILCHNRYKLVLAGGSPTDEEMFNQ